MNSLYTLKAFWHDEAGAVTVDWVVLTGAVVGLGIVVMNTIGAGIENLGQKIVDDLNNRNVGYVSQATP